MAIKRSSKNCKATISDTCPVKTALNCTEYDGILPTGSEYEDDDCLTGQDIVEDIISILDDHTDQLDFSNFGCCLQYEASDIEAGVTLQDVLSVHESILCSLQESCQNCSGNSESTECLDCDNLPSNFNGLVYNTVGSGNITLGGSYVNFSPINTYDLKYKTKLKGKYKITLEIDYTGSGVSSEVFSIGISIDGQQPSTGVFNQDTVKVANNTKVMHFIVEVDKGVVLLPYFKKAPTVSVIIEKVKLIIEKV